MTEQTILYGRVVTPYRVIERGMIVVRKDRIVYAGEREEQNLFGSVSVLEFDDPGCYIVPGFIDIHCHGGGGVWCYEDPEAFANFHLKQGTTSIFPTLHYNQSHLEIIEGLQRILSAMGHQPSSIAGIHMEGPYINPKYGAITSPIRPVNPKEYREILALAGERIKMWTLAPELEGQRQFMEEASRYGIVFSVGHSEATPEAIFAATRLGMRLGCHLTNASGVTPNSSRYEGTREVGVHEAVLVHDDMYAEVIPDSKGIHVRPLMLRLIVKTKGADKVIIITDTVPEPASQAGCSTKSDVCLEPGNAFSPHNCDEILSGSFLTMDRAVHNMRTHTGLGWVDACKMASLNPARALGNDNDLGSLECGKMANLLVVTETAQVKMVMLEGNIVHDAFRQ